MINIRKSLTSIKKKTHTHTHTHTFAVSGKIVLRGATLNSPAIYSFVYIMKHGVEVQFLKTKASPTFESDIFVCDIYGPLDSVHLKKAHKELCVKQFKEQFE